MPNPPVAPCFESMPCNGATETVNEVLPLHAALREAAETITRMPATAESRGADDAIATAAVPSVASPPRPAR
jgi:hypothetical protein